MEVREERISRTVGFWRVGEAAHVGEAKLTQKTWQGLVNHRLTALPSAGLRASLSPDLAEQIERVRRDRVRVAQEFERLIRSLPKNPPE